MINVGFLLNFPLGYKGGINYLKNLFYAVNKYHDDTIKIKLFVPDNLDDEYINIFGPYTEIIPTSILTRKSISWIISKVADRYFGFDPLIYKLLSKHNLQCISHSNYVYPFKNIKSINWIPDFQYLHYPNLWSTRQLADTKSLHTRLVKKSDLIILSSYNAKHDFQLNYNAYTDKVRVLHFVSQPDYTPDTEDIKVKYTIADNFFYLPNQFWSHKNHLVVFKAIALLKDKGLNIRLVTTGLLHDYRNNDHINNLKTFVKDNNIEENILFLGLVPYSHVLKLISESVAVINPSFFEGWSSTVEESKSLDRLIILSDIEVHKEQNPKKVKFFDPENAEDLAIILQKVWLNTDNYDIKKSADIIASDLEDRTKSFADNFSNILFEIVK